MSEFMTMIFLQLNNLIMLIRDIKIYGNLNLFHLLMFGFILAIAFFIIKGVNDHD